MNMSATELFWTMYGPGVPIGVVLLHDFADSGVCWELMKMPFMEYGAVLAVDARGHGRSPLLPLPIGPRGQAADHAAALADLDLTDELIVVGHGMGALTAMAFAALYPGLVHRLVLEDPPLDPAGGHVGADPGRPSGLPRWLAELRAIEDPAERLAAAKAQHPDWSEFELEPWANSKADLNPLYPFLPADPEDPVAAFLPRVTCPVLLLHGEPERGSAVTAEDLARGRDLLPDLRVEPIAGAGHHVRRDRPIEFLMAVKLFIHSLT